MRVVYRQHVEESALDWYLTSSCSQVSKRKLEKRFEQPVNVVIAIVVGSANASARDYPTVLESPRPFHGRYPEVP